MQLMGENWNADITALARSVVGKVELYNGSTLAATFLHTGELSSIKIERTAVNGMFFGYSICQKATVTLLDADNTITINKDDVLKLYLGTSTEFAGAPNFTVSDVQRDEIKKTLTITAYDLIESASVRTQSELQIEYPITPRAMADIIASALGTTAVWGISAGNTLADMEYTESLQSSLSGTETLRDMLGFIAQATGTVCFVNNSNKLCFKQLTNSPIFEIDKSIYFEMSVGKAINLTQVTSATDLGDNLTAGEEGGKNQVFYSNPFIISHESAATILDQLLDLYSQIVMYPYNIRWRGNPALEFGDCVKITLADNSTADVFYLGETTTYNGGIIAACEWEDEDAPESVDGNPTTLGDAIKMTYAKVDKANSQIDLVAKQVEENIESIGAIQVNSDSINASVESIRQNTEEALVGVNENIETLTNKVNAQITSEQVKLEIESALGNGVDKVVTSTGYSFNEEGLTVSKSNSEMSTQITEDGMTVYRQEEAVLVADHEGVKAEDLHATTYLIIGANSRFQDYADNTRTGCFWVGSTE